MNDDDDIDLKTNDDINSLGQSHHIKNNIKLATANEDDKLENNVKLLFSLG